MRKSSSSTRPERSAASRRSNTDPRATDAAASGNQVTLRERADALCRTAAECCRQHARYARLVDHDASAAEQRTACNIVELSDALLEETASAYSKAVTQAGADGVPSASGAAAEDGGGWWRPANMLLHAVREFLRRKHVCDGATRRLGAHTASAFEELTFEYELSASALLALQRAVDGYRRARPEFELTRRAGN